MLFNNICAAVCLCLASFLSNVGARPSRNLCDDDYCSGNGNCVVVDNAPMPICSCSEHFTGSHCETMISRRCYLLSDAPKRESGMRIPGIGKCPDPEGQWCLPDNFYCHFYQCEDSIGWCIKATGIWLEIIQSRREESTIDRAGKNFERDLISQS